jgi:ketosteroid isomerase-like protein
MVKTQKNMESPNRSTAQQFSQGNFAAAYSSFRDDIEWNLVGNKVVKGKDAAIDFCSKMLTEMASSVLTNDNCIETENQIVIEGKCRYFDAEGKEAFVHYCDIYRFEKDKIKTITSYCI